MTNSVAPTYRGFKNQALYILDRVLADADGQLVFLPEGTEDLAVYSSDQVLIEAVQVKDYRRGITFSDLKIDRPEGFFSRLLKRNEEHPSCTTKLASFGPLGPELEGGINGADDKRRPAIRKLQTNLEISESSADGLLDSLKGNVEHPKSEELTRRIGAALEGTAAAGHVATAIELLMFWVYEASERARPLTRPGLARQISAIGEFLAQSRDFALEWGSSIKPVSEPTQSASEKEELLAEYRRGVHARWEHVVADADCPRPSRIRAIHEAFDRESVVLLRGASGQGKSTLAWRYLAEHSTDGLRFSVSAIESRGQASRIASLLRAHVGTLGVKGLVLLDVHPQDVAWTEIVKGLQGAGLKVLVAIREEDLYRTQGSLDGTPCAEVQLNALDEVEAQEIFGALTGGSSPGHLSFQDAWEQFASSGRHALLEFAHLVTEGESLRKRLSAQLNRVQKSVSDPDSGVDKSRFRLLCRTLAVHAADARVDRGRALAQEDLSALEAPLRPFEGEYLFRSQNGLLSPLHPLRSQILCELLHEEAAEEWDALVVAAVEIVTDVDADRFLRFLFLTKPELSPSLLDMLAKRLPSSWTFFARTLDALLWEGTNQYEQTHHAKLKRAVETYGSGWQILGKIFPSVDSRGLLEAMSISSPPDLELPNVTATFSCATEWLRTAPTPSLSPRNSDDWSAVGDVAFWCGRLPCEPRPVQALRSVFELPYPIALPLKALGRLNSGMQASMPDELHEWCAPHEKELRSRLVRETASLALVDEDGGISVHYPLPPEAQGLNETSMKRIDLIYQVLPWYSMYGAHATAAELVESLGGHDDSTKQIPVENLFDEREVAVNATLLGLVSYRHQRAEDWKAYRVQIARFRTAVEEALHSISVALSRVAMEQKFKSKYALKVDSVCANFGAITEAPKLPKCVVDPFGFTSEGRNRILAGSPAHTSLALERYMELNRVVSAYYSHASTAIRFGKQTLISFAQQKLQNVEPSDDSLNARHLLVVNLGDAWDDLRALSTLSGGAVGALLLDDVSPSELKVVESFWHLALYLRDHGPLLLERQAEQLAACTAKKVQAAKEAILSEIALLPGGGRRVRLGNALGPRGESLAVIFDHETLPSKAEQIAALQAIRRGISSPNWSLLEWTPFRLQSPDVYVAHLVGGKLVAPEICRIPFNLLLAWGEEPGDIKEFLLLPQPASSEELKSLDLEVWATPIVRAAVKWTGACIFAFVTLAKWNSIEEIGSAFGVQDEDISPILADATRELTDANVELHGAHNEVLDQLEQMVASGGQHQEAASRWANTLELWPDGHGDKTPFPRYILDESPDVVVQRTQDLLEFALLLRSQGDASD